MSAERIYAWARWAALGLSALLCAAVSFCYYARPDSCAAVTSWPAWLWLAPGLVLTGFGWSRRGIRLFLAVVFLWIVYLGAFADEARGLVRVRHWPAPGGREAVERGSALRVISINCSGGNIQAAAEAAPCQPDIVLLQETPEKREVEKLAHDLSGKEAGIARGVDTDIIARGRISPKPRRGLPPFAFVQARVRLVSGIEAEVFSAHFQPPVMRFDVWSPSCWREHAEKRQVHLMQMGEIAQAVAPLPRALPVIVGGDFNVSGGDGVFRLLEPRLHDTFREGGIGWGDTVLNDLPVSRFDQVWASDQFRAAAVVARQTRYSDHRLVVCDLKLRPQGAQGLATRLLPSFVTLWAAASSCPTGSATCHSERSPERERGAKRRISVSSC